MGASITVVHSSSPQLWLGPLAKRVEVVDVPTRTGVVITRVKDARSGHWVALKSSRQHTSSSSTMDDPAREALVHFRLTHTTKEEEKRQTMMTTTAGGEEEEKEAAATTAEEEGRGYIVRALGAWQEDKVFVLATEWAAGGAVIDWMAKRETKEKRARLPEESARRWFRQLMLAIGYLHSRRVVHWDVASENILLTGDDGEAADLRLTDFGRAQPIACDTHSAQPTCPLHQQDKCRIRAFVQRPHSVGRIRCAPPELYAAYAKPDSAYCPRSVDFFTAGVVLFEWLIGYRVCEYPTPMDDTYAYIAAPGGIELLLEYWGICLSAPAVALLGQLLHPNHHMRGASAHAILAHPWAAQGCAH
jgi:serine/threonine protein kinase